MLFSLNLQNLKKHEALNKNLLEKGCWEKKNLKYTDESRYLSSVLIYHYLS